MHPEGGVAVESHTEPARGRSSRERLIEQHMPLARRLAARYRHSGEALDDLVQVACLGLIKAIDRYDPDAGPFARFAVPTITGELKRHFRDKGWAMRVPRDLQERAMSIGDAVDHLSTDLGRSPTPRDVATLHPPVAGGRARGHGRRQRVHADEPRLAPARQRGRRRPRPGAPPRRRRPRLRHGRAAPHRGARRARAAAPRARDPAAAVHRGHDPDRDRRPGRHLADARIAAAAPLAGQTDPRHRGSHAPSLLDAE